MKRIAAVLALGLLTAAIVVIGRNVAGHRSRERTRTAISQLRDVGTFIEHYRLLWPARPRLASVAALIASLPPAFVSEIRTNDPWGGPVHLRMYDDSYILWSDGPNRRTDPGLL